MMKALTIILLIPGFAIAQRKTSFQTQAGDIITIRGTDTTVAFAGNWNVSNDDKKGKPAKAIKPNTHDIFWDDFVIRKQAEYAKKAVQVHGKQQP